MIANFHTRADWNARFSSRPLTPFAPASVLGVVLHWNGPPISRTSNPRDVIRATQNFHMDVRHWKDIAYNLAVDWNGEVWEGRGVAYQNGAHDSPTANQQYVAIELMTGEGQPITPLFIEGVQHAIQMTRTFHPGARVIDPHSQWTRTACPGDEIRSLINRGAFEPPRPTPAPTPPTPPVPPTTKEDDMFIQVDLTGITAGPSIYLLHVATGKKYPVTVQTFPGKFSKHIIDKVSLDATESKNFLQAF